MNFKLFGHRMKYRSRILFLVTYSKSSRGKVFASIKNLIFECNSPISISLLIACAFLRAFIPRQYETKLIAFGVENGNGKLDQGAIFAFSSVLDNYF